MYYSKQLFVSFIFFCCTQRKVKFVCFAYLGTSKKKAKHNAAISLLNQMGVLPALVNGQSSNANGLEIYILNIVLFCEFYCMFLHCFDTVGLLM